MLNNNIVARRKSNNPDLRNVLYSLDVGASVKVKGSAVIQLAGSLSRTTKKRDNTRFAVKSLSNNLYKVTRVRSGKTPTYSNKAITQDNLQSIAQKLLAIVQKEIALIESL